MLGCLGLGSLTFALMAGRIIKSLGQVPLRVWRWRRAGRLRARRPVYDTALVVVGAYCAGLGYMMLHNTLQANATQMVPDDRSGAVSLFAFCLFTGQASGVALFAALTPLVGYSPAILAGGVIVLVVGLAFASAKQRHVAASEA